MAKAVPSWTAEELARLPEGYRYEIERGELIVREPTGIRHGGTAGRICILLGGFVAEHGLGLVLAAETGFFLQRDPDTVRAPDVAFISRERLDQIRDPDTFGTAPPDLAVEVLSPRQYLSDLRSKVDEYLRCGVRSVWVADPRRRTLHQYRRGEERQYTEAAELVEDAVLPGFACRLADLFVI
ncbi:MAG: Uma2 family endonuclease [Thermaerobacter sp.]|jgi:Uma2 family endonuclease|nr:Uma2 family endonuclease [Thermaerobacter sp.]